MIQLHQTERRFKSSIKQNRSPAKHRTIIDNISNLIKNSQNDLLLFFLLK